MFQEETQLTRRDLEGQERLLVRFEVRPKYNRIKSEGGEVAKMVRGKEVVETVEGEGKPVYDDVEYIEILNPGDPTSVIHRPIREADKARFAKQYADWKSKKQNPNNGIPLSEWSVIPPSLAKQLEHFHIFTVEQLAALSDSNMANIGPYNNFRDKARSYLAQSKEDNRDNEIASLKAQLAELAAKSADKKGKA